MMLLLFGNINLLVWNYFIISYVSVGVNVFVCLFMMLFVYEKMSIDSFVHLIFLVWLVGWLVCLLGANNHNGQRKVLAKA